MTNPLETLWKIITFPFILIFRIITFPFWAVRNAWRFLNEDTEDHPIVDTFNAIASEPLARESLWDHVEELRVHLFRILIGIAITVGISFYFTLPLMDYLAVPVGGLKELQAIEVTEEIGVYMRVALMSGITIGFPYLAFELWLFAAPGLRPRERKFSLLALPVATILFVGGVAFTFYVLLPAALPFLAGFSDISQVWSAKEYFSFITGLMLWLGAFFEFPLIIYVLSSIGLIKPALLAQNWRVAVVIIAVLAATVTPTVDPVNMALVMIPLILLYFLSIGLSYIGYAGRRRRNAEAEATPEM